MWKIDGEKLYNKAQIFESDAVWIFQNDPIYDNYIYVLHAYDNKALGVQGDEVVIEEVSYDYGQLWIKGKEDNENFTTLENYKYSKYLTAISSIHLKIKGNILTH